MTATTVALVGGVVLWQVRPGSEAAVPTTASHSRMSDGLTQLPEPAVRSQVAPQAQRSDAEMYSGLQSAAELYREQQAAAAERPAIERDCSDGVQPALCY